MPSEEDTAKAGAEPVKKEDTAIKAGAEPVKDAKTDSSTDFDNVPFDKDPRWKAARLAHKKLDELLKVNELTDVEDLAELVQKGKVVKGKLSDLNQLDALIEKAERLDKYEEYWQSEAEKKRREEEDPNQTIARLEAELKRRHLTEQQREEQRVRAEQANSAIKSYEREVINLVKEGEIPKEQQGFVLEFFGVGNPANDIDITDRKAIKKLIEEGIKKKETYDQAVIQAYIKGKGEILKIGSASSATITETKPKIFLKDARKIFLETMQKATGG